MGDSAPSASDVLEFADGGCLDILLVTANVGSLFEDPQRLLRPWMDIFLKKVSEIGPRFLALHLQEVGGKTYEKSMDYVKEFVKRLCEADEMEGYDFVRVYLDEDFTSAEHFTALGNLYFVHKTVEKVQHWNFYTHSWDTSKGKQIYTGNIETVATKEKAKFPQHFFPECKWSRKGFMRTRWGLNNTVFDLVNIHLFHDASNLAACEEFPSVYCKTRRRALVHTLERFHMDKTNGFVPFFLFGDFNFRCDTEGVIKELTENLLAHRVQSIKCDITKVHYRNSIGDNILTVGKKEFSYADHQLKFKESWLKKFDRELDPLREFLKEFPINFSPSYPYEEDPEMPTDFMSTRCPSWCDRVLMSPHAMNLINKDVSGNVYNIIGENVCMGDHKPVYLNVSVKTNQGIFACSLCHDINAHIHNSSIFHSILALGNIDDALMFPVGYPFGSDVIDERLNVCQPLNRENNSNLKSPLNCDGMKCNKILNNSVGDRKVSSGVDNLPTVNINVINPENIKVCTCSHISNDQLYETCVLCEQCKITNNRTIEAICKGDSKHLAFPNDIIVNRVDNHYLNAYFDSKQKCQEPYTPESTESHSPYHVLPDFCSVNLNSNVLSKECGNLLDTVSQIQTGEDIKTCNHISPIELRSFNDQRGSVSADILKLRLDNLRKTNFKHNFEFINDNDCADAVENRDVNNIEISYRPNDLCLQWYQNSCLRKCCNIQ